MKRREFLTAGAAAAVAGGLLMNDESSANAASDGTCTKRELIDVRILYTASEDSKKRLLDRCDQLLIPRCRELGLRKTGIFSVNMELHEGDKSFDPIYENAVFFMTSAPCFEKLLNFHEAMHSIAEADRRIQTFTADALYSEMEASLLRAFPQCPKLEVPNLSPDRVVQFRRYYSPSFNRSRAKMNMFDVRGELDLFKRCGMLPVFFGDMIYGNVMPNISYTLSFESNEARLANWKKFVTSDEWKVMSAEPAFKDTATRIRNLFLKPSAASEI